MKKVTATGCMLVLAVSLSACGNLAAGIFGPAGSPPLVTMAPNASATPTAFGPLSPTETPIPTVTPTPGPTATPTPVNPWGSFAGPVEPSAIEIPPPMPVLAFPRGTVNIALLGSDLRPNEGGWRTDTMVIVSLNPSAGTAHMLAIPRDLYVYIPGWRVDRINTADVRGGFSTFSQTLLYNFGIPLDFYVRIDFSGFTRIVDSLGGIDVQVTGYLNDECGRRYWTYSPGVYHMDGFTALCYVRMRKASSDFDRLRREEEVLLALFDRLLTADALTRAPELFQQFQSLVKTNLTLNDVLPLLPLGTTLASDRSRIKMYRLESGMTTPWRVPYSGAAVLLPNRDAIQTLLRTAFGS